MQYAIAAPTDETWNAIRGGETLPKSSATRLMENTLTRAMPSLGPAFAATLIAGVVRPPKSRTQGCLTVIRIGDGSVEIGKQGAARSSLFKVDNEETIISSALCPGPVGSDSLQRLEIASEEVLFGDEIAISTDGLTRGHQGGVMGALKDVCPSQAFVAGDSGAALIVLREASSVADRLPESDTRGLFEDNLTLVRIAVRQR
jgi:hypothetical protein